MGTCQREREEKEEEEDGCAEVADRKEMSSRCSLTESIASGSRTSFMERRTSPFRDIHSVEPRSRRPTIERIDTSYEPKMLRRSSDCLAMHGSVVGFNESKVLVFYVGGVIGKNQRPIVREEGRALLEDSLRAVSQLHDPEYKFAHACCQNKAPLVLPQTNDPNRVVYTICEYDPPLESANITMDDWVKIAVDILANYKFYDGFVVFHGTDTMTYTASALSFMFENLGKSVVITGSSIPIFEVRSDGRENLLDSLVIAGNHVIPEVTLLFNKTLFRGNRTIMVGNCPFETFASPTMSPLATISSSIEVNWNSVLQQNRTDIFMVEPRLTRNVVVLRTHPGMLASIVRSILAPPIQGVVLQTYGCGSDATIPKDLLEEIRQAILRGVLIVHCFQCTRATVTAAYETSQTLLEAGVIHGADMTPEAALTKLSYVIAKSEWSLDTKKDMLKANLRGELTVVQTPWVDNVSLIDVIAKSLNISSYDELQSLKTILYPSILCSVTAKNDLALLDTMRQHGAYLSSSDYDYRTPLHIAASEGNVKAVEYLLQNGAALHVRDREHNTPLMSAVLADQHAVIPLLVQAGAFLNFPSLKIADFLCTAARNGSVRRLLSFKLAGASLFEVDATRRTCLHVACEAGNERVVNFLLENAVCPEVRDVYGRLPREVAKALGHSHLVRLLDMFVAEYYDTCPLLD